LPSFDAEQVYQDALQHLIWMCQMGQKEYAWYRAKELAADETGLWRGIHIALTNHMRSINASTRDSEES
jgi:hypothetical protein